jgi:hypothetical protein
VYSLNYPQLINLGAGISKILSINFRPLSYIQYEDYLEFITSFGSFKIPLIATLPQHKLEFPSTINFGLCSVNQKTFKKFIIKNIGDKKTQFKWILPTESNEDDEAIDSMEKLRVPLQVPFTIDPLEGQLEPREKISVTVGFAPEVRNLGLYPFQ